MPVETIRSEVEEILNRVILEGDVEIERVEGHGHQAGIPVERWVKNKLDENITNSKIFFPNEFIRYLNINTNVKQILDSTWWRRLLLSRQQITAAENGEDIGTWQQSAADLVLFYGTDIGDRNKIILLNVKSHNTARRSRDPNIMSAYRLLNYFKFAIAHNFNLDEINIWFIGVDYHSEGTIAIVESIHVKDLFKLDLTMLPQINFDAAIQLQWHVRNMVECDQSKIEFVRSLAQALLDRWNHHVRNRTQKYERWVREIIESIETTG